MTSGWGLGRGKNIKGIAKLVDCKKYVMPAFLLFLDTLRIMLLFIYLSQNSSNGVSYIVLRSVPCMYKIIDL